LREILTATLDGLELSIAHGFLQQKQLLAHKQLFLALQQLKAMRNRLN